MKNCRSGGKMGFTLIETLVYLALYSIIALGMLSAVYSLIESSFRNETVAMVEEEGDYLTAKIDATLSDATSIQSPTASGDTLSVVESDGSNVTVKSNASGILLQEGSAPFQTLNNSNVSIVGLTFVHSIDEENGGNIQSVLASFTLFSTTSDGHALSREFSTTKYLPI
jgi:type II secretory pathway component PulJ